MPANILKTTCIAFYFIKGQITFQTVLNVTKCNYFLKSKGVLEVCIQNIVQHNSNHFLYFITIDAKKHLAVIYTCSRIYI